MVNKTYVGLGVLVILVLVIVFFNKSEAENPSKIVSSDVSSLSTGSEQVVFLGVDSAGYKPKEIVVQAGKPVVLKNDGSLGGCSLYPVQAELGLAGNLARNKEVRFVPQKKGTFPFSCSMGMIKGVIKVI